MTQSKSPFLVYQDILSPKICEQIVDDLDLFTPDTDTEGNPLPVYRHHEPSEETIFNHYQNTIDYIMNYYNTDGYKGTERVMFEFYGEGTERNVHCENSSYIDKKWARTTDRDLTAVIFLSNYNEQPPFDDDYEVYGGKLEFPQHYFGFNPVRGTMIVFPSGPHFINAFAPIITGELFVARFHIATKLPYMYDPSEFPGDYRTWFEGLY